MSLEIVRNNLVNVHADAIVNAANPRPIIGGGVDWAIHQAAGPALLESRREIGPLQPGEAAVTPAFNLQAKIVIHAVGPVWQGGGAGEAMLLRRCYDRSLDLAWKHGCTSVAFPLISSGIYGYPRDRSLQIAVEAFTAFLMHHEMKILLVVFQREAVELASHLTDAVERYIDECYVEQQLEQEYGSFARMCAARQRCDMQIAAAVSSELEQMLDRADAGFSETLLELIDRSGRRDSEVYKRANVDRKLFSKIRSNPAYRPSKSTALAFAVALELDLGQTEDLLERAGYALSHSSKADIIVEYFIRQKNYDINEINLTLFHFDQTILGCA